MGKVVVFLLVCALFLVVYLTNRSLTQPQEIVTQPMVTPTAAPTSVPAQTTSRSIFVAYWDCALGSQAYDEYYYFGVTPTYNGSLNTNDQGYTGLDECISNLPGKKYLTVRMLNQDTNVAIIQTDALQQRLMTETIALAREKGFDGIVLDLEMSSLSLTDYADKIAVFNAAFYQLTKNAHMSYKVAVYGDTFYRKRSFDIARMGEDSDQLLIMAYDFHKASGEPGPNFPFQNDADNPYDFQQMIADYKTYVKPQKLRIIFGMYGYDWLVDEKKRPIRPAKALPLTEINKTFIDTCDWKNCIVRRDATQHETEVEYVDKGDGLHDVWFEDQTSVAAKEKFLQSQGVTAIGFWVNGYF